VTVRAQHVAPKGPWCRNGVVSLKNRSHNEELTRNSYD
jgi:hypothetical protein